jgi:CRP/FNR family cyclic AMP-dependent transcriptional regulator
MSDIAFLSSIPIFASLTPDELAQLATQWIQSEKNENDIIFKKGDRAKSIYIIQEGSVKIHIKALNEEDLIITILHKGDIFGELTLFDDTSRTATAIAIEHTKLLEIPRTNFINSIKVHPDIAIAMLSMLSKRLRETNELMEKQTTRNVNDELESALTMGDRIADKSAKFIGSWTFIIMFTSGLIIWVLLNVYTILFRPVDPYPFILLNLILSCLAAIQAPVIMMSQGRQATKDHLSAEMDYKINLKAELQIQDIRTQLDKINRLDAKNFKELRHINNEILKRLDKLP